MPSYVYKARDRIGNSVQGTIVSADVDTVREVLRERDIYLTSAVPQKERAENNGAAKPTTRKRVKINDMVVMSRQLASLVRAGIPINEALHTVALQTESVYLQEVIQQVRRDILGGSSLTEAVARHPNVFSELYIALIRAGEAGGVLDETLETAAEQFDKEAELREKVKNGFRLPYYRSDYRYRRRDLLDHIRHSALQTVLRCVRSAASYADFDTDWHQRHGSQC